MLPIEWAKTDIPTHAFYVNRTTELYIGNCPDIFQSPMGRSLQKILDLHVVLIFDYGTVKGCSGQEDRVGFHVKDFQINDLW